LAEFNNLVAAFTWSTVRGPYNFDALNRLADRGIFQW